MVTQFKRRCEPIPILNHSPRLTRDGQEEKDHHPSSEKKRHTRSPGTWELIMDSEERSSSGVPLRTRGRFFHSSPGLVLRSKDVCQFSPSVRVPTDATSEVS